MAEIYVASADAIAFTTAKTLLEISTPATRRAWIRRWWVTMDGVTSANTPALIELLRATAVITGTTITARNPVNDFSGPVWLSAVRHTATAEGTPGQVLEHIRIPPTGGMMFQWAVDAYVLVKESAFWRIRATAAQAVNAAAGFEFGE